MEIVKAIFGWAILLGLIVSPYYVIKWLRAADRRSAQKNKGRLEREHQRTAASVPGKPERAFLKACTHCGVFAITLPFRDNLGRTYCSEACMQWLGEGPRSFCKKCLFETVTQSSGNLSRINGIGTAFGGSSEPCPMCRSVIKRVWFTALLIPIVPLARYRVIQISPREFLSRRLRK
jgi:hypothetical protein